MGKKKKKNVPAKKKPSKTMEVCKTLLAEEVKPFDGLVIGKKQKYYEKYPTVTVENRWGNMKKKDAVIKALVDLIIPNFSLDPKRNKIGLRLIRETEQFDPDYTFEKVTKTKVVPRKPEQKVDEETLEIDTEYYADFIEMGSERKTEKVKAVASKKKDVLIETERGLEHCKVHHLYTEDLKYKEKTEVIGKTKAQVFRFIGIDFDIAKGNKAKIRYLKKDQLYVIKGVVKLTKITSKIVKQDDADGSTCFHLYGTRDEDAMDIVPGKILVKFDEKGVSFYILLEKTPSKDGLRKSFNLFEMFKIVNKRKKKKEVDLQSKIAEAFGGTTEEDADEEDEDEDE